MPIYELLDEHGGVENTIVADEPYVADNYPGRYREVEPSPVLLDTRITKLAFMSRFSDAEAVAIDLASLGATPEAALIRRYLSKVQAAEHIDLSRADLGDGLGAIEAAGLLAPGRATEILTAPVQQHEVAPR